MLSVAPWMGAFPCLCLRLCCNRAGEQAGLPGRCPEPATALTRAEGKSPSAAWPAAARTRRAAFRPVPVALCPEPTAFHLAPQGWPMEPLPTVPTTRPVTKATTAPITTPSSPVSRAPTALERAEGVSGVSWMQKSLCFREEGEQKEKEIL